MAAVAPLEKPKTVQERCLIGWFSRDDAIKHLTEEVIDPNFDANTAAQVWELYHNRVLELPERDATAPDRLPLTPDEQAARTALMRMHHGAANIRDVIKIDPCRCVAWQLLVIVDRAEMYATATSTREEKARHCLGLNQAANVPLPMMGNPNLVRVTLPHAEFMLMMNPNNGRLEIQQLARHISVGAFDSRLLLVGGYHRSFALSALHNPEAIERSLVVALTTDADVLVSPDSPNQTVREMVRSLRPPLFADFFDDRLCMSLRVRKRRPELWIQGQIRWFDDPN